VASRTWRIIVPNIYINRLQEPAVLYNYKAINITLNSLDWIPFII
jgi:hypothetical protein